MLFWRSSTATARDAHAHSQAETKETERIWKESATDSASSLEAVNRKQSTGQGSWGYRG